MCVCVCVCVCMCVTLPGSRALLNFFEHLGFSVTASQQFHWSQIVEAHEKRNSIKRSLAGRQWRQQLKQIAISETSTPLLVDLMSPCTCTQLTYCAETQNVLASQRRKVMYKPVSVDPSWVASRVCTFCVGECASSSPLLWLSFSHTVVSVCGSPQGVPEGLQYLTCCWQAGRLACTSTRPRFPLCGTQLSPAHVSCVSCELIPSSC
jgi:hypothetical protein